MEESRVTTTQECMDYFRAALCEEKQEADRSIGHFANTSPERKPTNVVREPSLGRFPSPRKVLEDWRASIEKEATEEFQGQPRNGHAMGGAPRSARGAGTPTPRRRWEREASPVQTEQFKDVSRELARAIFGEVDRDCQAVSDVYRAQRLQQREVVTATGQRMLCFTYPEPRHRTASVASTRVRSVGSHCSEVHKDASGRRSVHRGRN